jgi:hypothetical protein
MYVRISEMKNAINTDMRNAVKTVAYFLSIFMPSLLNLLTDFTVVIGSSKRQASSEDFSLLL